MKREKSNGNVFLKVTKIAQELITRINKKINLRKVENFQSGENTSRPVRYTRTESDELIQYRIDTQGYNEQEIKKFLDLLRDFIYGFPEFVDAYIVPTNYNETIDESSITLTFSKDNEYDISVKSALVEMCASLDIPLIVDGKEIDAYNEFISSKEDSKATSKATRKK